MLDSSTSDASDVWYVPITYATEKNLNFDDVTTDFWLTTQDIAIEIENLEQTNWILVNKLARG